MKKILFILGFAFFTLSCDIHPDLEEVHKLQGDELRATPGKTLPTLLALPAKVSLSRIDLYLEKGSAVTGTVTVDVRDATDSISLGSITIPASSLTAGASWKTFLFSPALTLQRTAKYRIHLRRSDAHNYTTNNYIFWRTSSGGVDAYADGINDVHPGWTLDYAFKTYTNGGLDQQQTQINYGFFVGNTFTRWQEFKADYPKVALTYVDLNLYVGSVTTGTVTVQIRNENGTQILGGSTVSTASLLVGTNWKKFKVSATLYRDQKYRIYITRSDAHNYAANNYIFWKCSSNTINAYPDGVNDVYPAWQLDFAFKTYSSVSGLDQQQTLNTYGFFTSSSLYRWQEFVPRHQ